MLKLSNKRLTATAKGKLLEYQLMVDTGPTYPERVTLAKKLFSRYNTASNVTFREVKSVLTAMCRSSRRCMYCEDSVADEVEHFQPKDLYPEVVFAWNNYLYACGPCNGPKNNQFAVLVENQLVNVTRMRDADVLPPVRGKIALIDPRKEDPLKFLLLDLIDTFEFAVYPGISKTDHDRANYTLEVLRLNSRDYLVAARRNAFSGYRARLQEYVLQLQAGASRTQLKHFKEGIQRTPHPTVWNEMIRQHQFHPELKGLFEAAPDALTF